MDKKELGLAVLVGAIGFPLLVAFALGASAYFSFANGFVMAKLWSWYAVPLGVRAFDWRVFAILTLGVRTILPSRSDTKEDKRSKSEKVAAVIVAAGAPWFTLLLGWVLK